MYGTFYTHLEKKYFKLGGIGHLLGAAGGVESAFVALSIRQNRIPPSINIDNRDPVIPADFNIVTTTEFSPELSTVPDGIPRRLTLKNSFGFGGTNVSLLFAEYLD